MTNPNNNGTIVGRVAADSVAFTNSDNSHTVKLGVYADNNFKNRDNSRGSQRLPLQSDYIRPETDYTKIPFSNAREGDLVSIATHIEEVRYTDKESGRTVYGVAIVIDDFWFHEGQGVRDARAAEKAQKNQGQAQPAQAPVSNPAPVAQAPQTQPAAAPQPQAQPVQGLPAWAAAQPVAVPAQAQTQPAQAQPVATGAPVAVPAQVQTAAPARALHDDPPF